MKITLKFLKEQINELMLRSKSISEFNKDNPSIKLKTNSSPKSNKEEVDRKDLFYEIPKEKLEKDQIINIKKFIANNINSSFEKIYLTKIK